MKSKNRTLGNEESRNVFLAFITVNDTRINSYFGT